MGDRCTLTLSLRKTDIPAFAVHAGFKSDECWWNDEWPEEKKDIATLTVYEANYALYEARLAAAKAGIVFVGTHTEGGTYGSYAFAAIENGMCEAPLDHDGRLSLAVNEDLKPLEGTEQELSAYVAKARAVRMLFANP